MCFVGEPILKKKEMLQVFKMFKCCAQASMKCWVWNSCASPCCCDVDTGDTHVGTVFRCSTKPLLPNAPWDEGYIHLHEWLIFLRFSCRYIIIPVPWSIWAWDPGRSSVT